MAKPMQYLLLLSLLFTNMAIAQVLEKTVEQRYESAHPYANGIKKGDAKYSWNIAPAGATKIRVYFEYLDVESKFDFIDLSSDKLAKGPRLTGKQENFWSEWLPGSKMAIHLISDGSGNGKGFAISRYQYQQQQEVIKGKLWAVVVGISQYEDKNFGPLPLAVKDAEKLQGFLTDAKGGGLDAEQVRYLKDAKKVEINESYGWLHRNVAKEDRVLFFYAGHGEVDKWNTAYLIPKDGHASYDSEGTVQRVDGIDLQKWRRDLWSLRAQQVALVLDCCYSGTMISDKEEGSELRAGIKRLKQNRKQELDLEFAKQQRREQEAPQEQHEQPERIVITSCKAAEKALELSQYKQGAFSFYLMQGLRGLADSNGDKRIELKEAFAYLENKVTELAKRKKHTQTPPTLGYIRAIPRRG